jgi:hypothetical protein
MLGRINKYLNDWMNEISRAKIRRGLRAAALLCYSSEHMPYIDLRNLS